VNRSRNYDISIFTVGLERIMNSEKLTREQIERCLADLAELRNKPEGVHLTEGEFTYYSLGTLSADDAQRIDEHLKSCMDCCTKLEWMLSMEEEELRADLVSVWNRLTAIFTLPKTFDFANTPARMAAASIPRGGEYEGCTWLYSPHEDGSLGITVGISQSLFRNALIRLRSGDSHYELKIVDIGSSEYAGTITIPASELTALSHSPLLREIHLENGTILTAKDMAHDRVDPSQAGHEIAAMAKNLCTQADDFEKDGKHGEASAHYSRALAIFQNK
jgi:hypothetical protein